MTRRFIHDFTRTARQIGSAGFVGAALIGGAVLLPGQAWAQGGSGFLFDPPRASIGAKFSYSVPSAGSDIFGFAREQFTLDGGDFRSPQVGGEFAVRVTERLDLAADLGWTRSRQRSEYRDWVDLDGLPIEQDTTFERTSLTLGAKYYLKDRGRRIGQFAWVPNGVAPYVGAGVGVMWHDLVQSGDFVDIHTYDVYSDRLQTTGVAPIADVRAGADIPVGRAVFLTGEARYNFGSGPSRGDYVGFGDTDLSGLTLTFGISFRFSFDGR